MIFVSNCYFLSILKRSVYAVDSSQGRKHLVGKLNTIYLYFLCTKTNSIHAIGNVNTIPDTFSVHLKFAIAFLKIFEPTRLYLSIIICIITVLILIEVKAVVI